LKTRIVRAYKDLESYGAYKFTFQPDGKMKRIKGIIMGHNCFLTIANEKGEIINDLMILLGYMRANTNKVKVDIPLNGKPIYGRVRSDNYSQMYQASIYFIVEQED